MRPFSFFALTLPLLALTACQPAKKTAPVKIDTEVYNKIQTQLIDAQPGSTIELPAGTFHFDRPLSLDDIKNVTIKGAGMNKTIFSFSGQKAGAEGLKITADSVTLVDFTIQDTKGDAIKVQDSKGVTFRRVKATWSEGPKTENGGYGLYPVACDGVLIEHCEVSGASDAGIYVGQSRNVIVRNSYAHENVAGIEIENCTNAEVYDCKSENNSGGILVFDLPGLPAGNGRSCKVHNNKIIGNNHHNFAAEGNIVGTVAPGTGMILLAAKDVEVYDNQIIGHKTMGIAIASYQITELKWDDAKYDPYSYDIKLHNNHFERKKAIPDLTKDFGKLINLVFIGKPQDIIYDGITDDKRPKGSNPMNLCIDQPQEGLRFGNVDAAHEFKNVVTDLAAYKCQRSL